MSRLIVITSGKGGVGKTTTAINLGTSLNSFGENVVIVDANLTTPNIGIHLGSPVVPINLHNVLSGKNKINEAVYEHYSGTKIVPASLSIDDLKYSKPEKLSLAMKNLKKKYDLKICDSAAGLGREAAAAISIADEVLVVTNPELPAVTDALKVTKFAEELGKKVTGVIIARDRKNKNQISSSEIESMLEKPVIAVIPEDHLSIKEALVQKDAVIHVRPNSKIALSYKELAAKLLGKKYIKPSLFSRIFDFFN